MKNKAIILDLDIYLFVFMFTFHEYPIVKEFRVEILDS